MDWDCEGWKGAWYVLHEWGRDSLGVNFFLLKIAWKDRQFFFFLSEFGACEETTWREMMFVLGLLKTLMKIPKLIIILWFLMFFLLVYNYIIMCQLITRMQQWKKWKTKLYIQSCATSANMVSQMGQGLFLKNLDFTRRESKTFFYRGQNQKSLILR